MAATKRKSIAVALQGGGSHGAFTWGVLDRLLEVDDLDLAGFVGTSAGAMNAALLAYGLHKSGKSLAKELLEEFWKKASNFALFSPLQPSWYDKSFGTFGNMDYSFGYKMTEMMSLFLAPAQTNPKGYNPLRDILGELIDCQSLRNCRITKLFVCATNVRRGRAKVFPIEEITIEALLASACLPQLFNAITIDGEDYWDGGYMGNPPIFPLIDGTNTTDILLVQINPINIPETPRTADEIRDRVNELSFNSSLMLEMRRIDFVDRLLSEGYDLAKHHKMRKIFFHNINPETDIWALNVSSKLNATWDFLMHLKQMGRNYADEWLAAHYDKVGVASSCDIRATFL